MIGSNQFYQCLIQEIRLKCVILLMTAISFLKLVCPTFQAALSPLFCLLVFHFGAQFPSPLAVSPSSLHVVAVQNWPPGTDSL